MVTSATIRPARASDAESIGAIYNAFIAATTITFEEAPVTPAEMARRLDDVDAAGLPWLVATVDGEIIGYAYATRWRARAAYRFSVESTIYFADSHQGQGHGAALYLALLGALRGRGLRTVIAGIAQPNARSVALHERLGFRKVAHFENVGFKLKQWIDVAYWQLQLDQSHSDQPLDTEGQA